MKFALIAVFIAFELSLVHSINWQPGNWASGCKFNMDDNNLSLETGWDPKECIKSCQSKSGCTHCVHILTKYSVGGGTCYMKKGNVRKTDAIDNGNESWTCGIIKGIEINYKISLIL